MKKKVALVNVCVLKEVVHPENKFVIIYSIRLILVQLNPHFSRVHFHTMTIHTYQAPKKYKYCAIGH